MGMGASSYAFPFPITSISDVVFLDNAGTVKFSVLSKV